jgi:hypothetical protein
MKTLGESYAFTLSMHSRALSASHIYSLSMHSRALPVERDMHHTRTQYWKPQTMSVARWNEHAILQTLLNFGFLDLNIKATVMFEF